MLLEAHSAVPELPLCPFVLCQVQMSSGAQEADFNDLLVVTQDWVADS